MKRLLTGALILLTACRETPPEELTSPVFESFNTEVTADAADITVTYSGSGGVVEAGVYVGESIPDRRVVATSSRKGRFTVHLSDLNPSTTYKYKAFLSSGLYEITSLEQSFTTLDPPEKPKVIVEGTRVTVQMENGRLETILEEWNVKPGDIETLILIGSLAPEDFVFMQEKATSLETLDLRETDVTVIPKMAFFGKKLLSSVLFPAGLIKIGDQAFGESGLERIDLPDSVEEIGVSAFSLCDRLKGTVILPKALKTLGGAAFYECPGLTGVKIQDGLQSIGMSAFQYCYSLTGKLSLPESLTEIGEQAFSGTDFRGDLVIPSGIRSIPTGAFNGSGFDGRLVLQGNVVEIGEGAFASNHFTGELKLPEGLRLIGNSAFLNAGFSGTLKLPASLKQLGVSAFLGNSFTGDLVIPENIKDIPASAFSCDLYLQQYTRVVLHKDVRTIGGAAFIPQEGFLKEVVCYNENPPQLGDESFCSAELPFISLRVPADAVQRYREAAGWQEFGSISPIE